LWVGGIARRTLCHRPARCCQRDGGIPGKSRLGVGRCRVGLGGCDVVGVQSQHKILGGSLADDSRQGITFTSVGVGQGAYDDQLLEQLANKGDGNYIYLDSPTEARHVFTDQFAATLQLIARDVKIQVEFNPKRVRRYRLIGYENRAIADQDFRNDKVDAGEIGSGQSATALYQVELLPQTGSDDDLGTVYIRYKHLDDEQVDEFATRLASDIVRDRTPESDPRFALAAGVATFAELLRQDPYVAEANLYEVEQYLIRVANQLPLDQQVQALVRLVHQSQNLPVAGK